jgi:hypothetical protein
MPNVPTKLGYLYCHPTQTKMYVAYNVSEFYQHIYELDMDRCIAKQISNDVSSVAFLSVADEGLYMVKRVMGTLSIHLIDFQRFRSGLISYRQMSYAKFAKRICPDKSEQLVVFEIEKNGKPCSGFSVFDFRSREWVDHNQNQFYRHNYDKPISIECVSNGDLCVKNGNFNCLYVLSYSTNRWSKVRFNFSIERIIPVADFPVVGVQSNINKSRNGASKSLCFLVLQDELSDKERNEKLLTQEETPISRSLCKNDHTSNIFLRDRLAQLALCGNRDLIIKAGTKTISVHSFLMEATSGYYEAMCSFHSETAMKMDLTEMIDENLLHFFFQLLYNTDIHKTWSMDVLLEMLEVVDLLCCPTLVRHLTCGVVAKLSVDNLVQVMCAWRDHFSHIEVIQMCCWWIVYHLDSKNPCHTQLIQTYNLCIQKEEDTIHSLSDNETLNAN